MPDRVDINEAEYRREFESRDGMVGRDLERRATRVQLAAKAQAGVQSGQLKASIHKRWTETSGDRLTIQVGSPVRHARVHHDGSRAHVIRARSARPMRWIDENTGNVVFARTVHHPGTRSNRYLTDNLRLATD
jgi:hypothetical protein